MYYQAHDKDIEKIYTRKNHKCYGMGLGIIILDDVYPGFPGDVRNASAFPFPIQYEVVFLHCFTKKTEAAAQNRS